MSKIRRLFCALALVAVVAGPAPVCPPLHAASLSVGPSHESGSSLPLRGLLSLAALVGVSIQVKDPTSSAKKFVDRAGSAGPEYSKGIAGSGPRWAANAKAGEQNWKTGVQDAATRGAFGKGIDKAGAGKFEANATKLGTQRYPDGVANAEGAYQNGVAPFLNALKSADIPARGPKGSQQNKNRADAVAVLLRKVKVGG